MTESEFLALEPRERDKIVSMGAMDNKPLRFGDVLADCHDPDALGWLILTGDDTAEFCHYPPNYTTDIRAAWQVVEKGRLDHLGWNAFYKAWDCDVTIKGKMGRARADTAPLSIAIAALKAKGVIE